MRNALCRLCLFFVIALSPIMANAAQIVGKATSVIGDVKIKTKTSQALPLAQGMDIALGDTILTSKDGFVTLSFLDKSTMNLNGQDGSLTIDEYVFDPSKTKDNTAKFSVMKSSFEFIGGLLDKGDDEKVQIHMDFGSIGVRGTKVMRSVRNNECWIYLAEGSVRVFNDGGEVMLKAGEGTRMHDRAIAPLPAEPWSDKDIAWIKKTVAKPR